MGQVVAGAVQWHKVVRILWRSRGVGREGAVPPPRAKQNQKPPDSEGTTKYINQHRKLHTPLPLPHQ